MHCPLSLCRLLSSPRWPVVGIRDLMQSRQAILRNYPIAAHIRFIFEASGPEIRQYSSKTTRDGSHSRATSAPSSISAPRAQLDKRPFGTQHDVYGDRLRMAEPFDRAARPRRRQPFRVTIGGPDCRQPYSASIFNISAMSFGALSANAIRALNQGAKMGDFAHDTGEGGISRYHREHGGDMIWEIGTGYFGCRNADGSFEPEQFAAQARGRRRSR